MNMVTVTSSHSHNTTLSQTLASDSDPPFSPYSNNKEASFIGLNVAEPTRIRNLSPIFTAAQEIKHNSRLGKKEEDDEIGVFRAEKYFNGAIDDDTTSSRSSSTTVTTRESCQLHHHYKSDNLRPSTALNLDLIRARIQPRTPSSVRSESSWNSRSILLESSGEKNSSTTKNKNNRNKIINGKKFLSSFVCKCYCSDKNSVETKHVGEISFNKSSTSTNITCKSSSLHHHHSHRPNLDISHIDTEPIQIHKPPKVDMLSSKPPHSSEVVRTTFQAKSSPVFRCKSPEFYASPASLSAKVNKTMSLERRLTMMSWDRTSPRQEEMVFKAAAGSGGGNHHDSGSDASSDLFEIDSLTGKTNPFMAQRASEDNSAGCATPTTGYAPSEASIQWSVVTASAADCSVTSDFDDSVSRAAPRPRTNQAAAGRTTDAAVVLQQRRRASALLGCKSQKAVSVAGGEAYRASPSPSPRRPPPPGYEAGSMRLQADSPARFQAEIANLSDGFSVRVGQEQRSLAQIPRMASPSPRNNSHLLYIQ